MTDIQCVKRTDTVAEALQKFQESGEKPLVIVDHNGTCDGLVSLDDLTRFQESGASASDDLSKLDTPEAIKVVDGSAFKEIADAFEQSNLDELPLVDGAGKPVRLLERQDYERIHLSPPHMGDHEFEYVKSAFDTNWIAPAGPNLKAFETEICEYLGVAHAVALSSGTAAIHLALIALGVSRGDTVLCSTLTFAASANPIRYVDAEPVFIDSEPSSWNMCPKALQAAIDHGITEGKKPKVAIVVSLYGQSADMDPIREICAHHDIMIVEDAAEALGAQYNGRPAGTTGSVGVYSFNGNKIITTSGGGALVTNDKSLADEVRSLATQARKAVIHYEHEQIGYNYRLSNVLAGIGRGQLRVLDDRVNRRRAIFDLYQANLGDIPGISFMPEPDGFHSTRWLTVMLLSKEANGKPGDLIDYLDKHAIEARPVWKPMHAQPVFEAYAYFSHEANHSVSDELFAEGVCLPSGSNNSDRAILRIVNRVQEFFAQA